MISCHERAGQNPKMQKYTGWLLRSRRDALRFHAELVWRRHPVIAAATFRAATAQLNPSLLSSICDSLDAAGISQAKVTSESIAAHYQLRARYGNAAMLMAVSLAPFAA